MFDPNNIFNALILIPILNVLVVLYKALLFLRIPGALGFSLILLTVLIRLVLHPFTKAQLESAQKLNRLKPELDRLNSKHKDDKQTLHQEQLKLYQQAGINPAAGCLPLIIQMPILIGLYNLFFQLLNTTDMSKVVEGINKVVYLAWFKIEAIDLSFLGANLAYKPNEWQSKGWWLLLVPVVTGLLQYWQTKQMLPSSTTPPSVDKSLAKIDDKKKERSEDMAGTMQKQMSIMMPVMIGFFAYSFPLGLSLYWNTFTIFGIIQQYQIAQKKG